jgi:hypothetical protein
METNPRKKLKIILEEKNVRKKFWFKIEKNK